MIIMILCQMLICGDFFCCQHSHPLWRRVCDDFPRGQQLWTKGGVRGSTRFPIQCWPWNTPKLSQTHVLRKETSAKKQTVIWWFQICLFFNIQSSWDDDPDWFFWVWNSNRCNQPLPNQQAACCKPEGLRGWNRGSTEDQGGLGGVETWEARDPKRRS